MTRIIITVDNFEQAEAILAVLTEAEEEGTLDFAFGTETVVDAAECVVCGKPARPYSSHCSACLAKLPKEGDDNERMNGIADRVQP